MATEAVETMPCGFGGLWVRKALASLSSSAPLCHVVAGAVTMRTCSLLFWQWPTVEAMVCGLATHRALLSVVETRSLLVPTADY